MIINKEVIIKWSYLFPSPLQKQEYNLQVKITFKDTLFGKDGKKTEIQKNWIWNILKNTKKFLNSLYKTYKSKNRGYNLPVYISIWRFGDINFSLVVQTSLYFLLDLGLILGVNSKYQGIILMTRLRRK